MSTPKNGFLSSYGQLLLALASVVALGATTWVQANYPTRAEVAASDDKIVRVVDEIRSSLSRIETDIAVLKHQQAVQGEVMADGNRRLRLMEDRMLQQMPRSELPGTGPGSGSNYTSNPP